MVAGGRRGRRPGRGLPVAQPRRHRVGGRRPGRHRRAAVRPPPLPHPRVLVGALALAAFAAVLLVDFNVVDRRLGTMTGSGTADPTSGASKSTRHRRGLAAVPPGRDRAGHARVRLPDVRPVDQPQPVGVRRHTTGSRWPRKWGRGLGLIVAFLAAVGAAAAGRPGRRPLPHLRRRLRAGLRASRGRAPRPFRLRPAPARDRRLTAVTCGLLLNLGHLARAAQERHRRRPHKRERRTRGPHRREPRPPHPSRNRKRRPRRRRTCRWKPRPGHRPGRGRARRDKTGRPRVIAGRCSSAGYSRGGGARRGWPSRRPSAPPRWPRSSR